MVAVDDAGGVLDALFRVQLRRECRERPCDVGNEEIKIQRPIPAAFALVHDRNRLLPACRLSLLQHIFRRNASAEWRNPARRENEHVFEIERNAYLNSRPYYISAGNLFILSTIEYPHLRT